ncbi:hypothetical protein EX30DRAFT_206850 [Ascodesmis nigricans]|uniref:Uncharacterized protein n=1 Tax=Ascodesmis nigricans TaxID=341454 RepID=A0A4S2MK94_9PEZI|nr:hypothetical protein EX30DRAFT_206850 [Ascodesmis nigricans]
MFASRLLACGLDFILFWPSLVVDASIGAISFSFVFFRLRSPSTSLSVFTPVERVGCCPLSHVISWCRRFLVPLDWLHMLDSILLPLITFSRFCFPLFIFHFLFYFLSTGVMARVFSLLTASSYHSYFFLSRVAP